MNADVVQTPSCVNMKDSQHPTPVIISIVFLIFFYDYWQRLSRQV